MRIISEKDRRQIEKILGGMKDPVKLIHFTRETECDTCDETRALLEELAAISDNLSLEVIAFDAANEFGVDKVPATVIERADGQRLRFYGIPAGYEFASLLDAIVLVSKGDSELAPESRTLLASVRDPLHLEVLVTPTCPYCPRAVRLAYQLALENPNITADAVEIGEFPSLGQQYRVMGVPKTMINGRDGIDGALPESAFVPMLLLSTREGVA